MEESLSQLKVMHIAGTKGKENSIEDIHFFRFLTLLALKIFTEEKVDVAILEVGLGGNFDATNVVKSPVVCGISSLGYEHMEILGMHFDRALFVPSHSSFTQFGSNTSTGPDSPKVDLKWQLFLQRTWENIICGCRENDEKIEPCFSPIPPCEFLLCEPSLERYSNTKDHLVSAVLPSVPLTIKWLRECVQQSHSLRLQILVTSSLHLIGDVLWMLKK